MKGLVGGLREEEEGGRKREKRKDLL